MKKSIMLVSLTMSLTLPAFSHAAPACFTDGGGSFYRLEVKPACKASSSKIAALNGRRHGVAICSGTNIRTLVGTCSGLPGSNAVVVGLHSPETGGDMHSARYIRQGSFH